MAFEELIIGCGAQKNKKLMGSDDKKSFVNPTTLDINPDHNPDIVHDLEILPLPFDDNSFNEIHAYEVLEHTGTQGDYIFFFAQFSEFWRILKPNGHICATVPAWNSVWAWGDPSHKRIINQETLVFLSQQEYKKQIGKTAMSDFRYVYKADFRTVFFKPMSENSYFMLKAIK